MKHGLRASIPFAKKWLVEPYGIYTQFFQHAAVGSYFTLGVDFGYNLNLKVKGENVALGYVSLGFYTELGNSYDSGPGHFRIGSAWRF